MVPSQNNNTSSTNKRFIRKHVLPTLIPFVALVLFSSKISLHNPSITRKNTIGDNAQPSLKPYEGPKNFEVDSLIRTKNDKKVTLLIIQFITWIFHPMWSNINLKYVHLSLSYALEWSILTIKAGSFFILMVWNPSWAITIASWIYLSQKIPSCSKEGVIKLVLVLKDIIFVIILYN